MTNEELQQVADSWRKNIASSMADVKMRQWCVEKSIESGAISLTPGEIHHFITAPLDELLSMVPDTHQD
jgi:hypothetical protein